MTYKINTSSSNLAISNIYRDVLDKTLVLQPVFQRKFVWTPEHEEQFIDTILKGLPFPEIYVCQGETDITEKKITRNVIDGQQRLRTIIRYIDGVSDKHFRTTRGYAQLKDEDKQSFLSYEIVVRDIGKVDDTMVKDIFRRINLTKFKLEDIEIHNAIYDGEFIQTAKTILEQNDLKKYGVFGESSITRMADLHFILLVMSTIEEGGYFARDRELKKHLVRNNEEYTEKGNMITLLRTTFNEINKLNLPMDTIWFRKSNFYTLVVETAKHIDQLPNDFFKRLTELEKNILAGKNNSKPEFSSYYNCMYQGTHDRKARVVRSEYCMKYIFTEKYSTKMAS